MQLKMLVVCMSTSVHIAHLEYFVQRFFTVIYLQDTKTVQWLKDYLTGLTQTTVLIVSHDTPFLEETVSDVIHYEQRPQWGPHRKLVHYAGKMSAFVKKQPQAKHYFELATTDLKSIVFVH